MKIEIPTPLRVYSKNQATISVEARTVAQAVSALTALYPDFQKHLYTPEGKLRIVLDDAPPDASKRLMEAFYKGQVTPELLLACGGTIAPWMASLTFFGRDLRQVAIGSLKGTRLAVFTAPVSGLPMTHWNDTVIAV